MLQNYQQVPCEGQDYKEDFPCGQAVVSQGVHCTKMETKEILHGSENKTFYLPYLKVLK